MTRVASDRIVRFLIVGGFNTGLTYGLYLGLLWWLPPWLAYGLAYAVGIGIAFIGNRMWVFGSQRSWIALVPYAGAQVVLLGIGSLVSQILTGDLPDWMVGLAAIAVVLPLSFLMNTRFFRPRATATAGIPPV